MLDHRAYRAVSAPAQVILTMLPRKGCVIETQTGRERLL
jgi:hypothetical protein